MNKKLLYVFFDIFYLTVESVIVHSSRPISSGVRSGASINLADSRFSFYDEIEMLLLLISAKE